MFVYDCNYVTLSSLRFFFLDKMRYLVVFLRITEKYLRNIKISN